LTNRVYLHQQLGLGSMPDQCGLVRDNGPIAPSCRRAQQPRWYIGFLCASLLVVAWHPRAEGADSKSFAFFENEIRPLLVEHCVKCHGSKKPKSNLRLDVLAGAIKGGDSGPAIVPGKAGESLIIKAVRHEGELKMPPKEKLADREIAALVKWIERGAAWPDGVTLRGKRHALRGGAITAKERAFWSFQPIKDPPSPRIEGAGIKNDIDRFVIAALRAANLKPAPPADRRVLIRRATFDLTGLPPTPKDIQDFLDDRSPEAFQKVVDRLLKSPAYGERWGRHWLDVVRYADTAGETGDFPTPLSYKYRNWVINALNADKPYDQFVREQIAGDILAKRSAKRAAKISNEQYKDMLTATGFIAISRRFGFDPENYHHLTIQDTIDTVGQAFLGLSLGCARCHDHKYDPINTADYYAWYGIFDSTRYSFPGSEQKKKPYDLFSVLPLDVVEGEKTKHAATLAKIDAEIKRLESQKKPLAGTWRDYINQRRLKSMAKDRDGHAGFQSWYTNSKPYQVPLVAVNTSDQTLKVPGTVPPGKLVLHPQNKEGVGIAWRSPIAGRVRVSGSVQDAHDCGDSVAWFIDHLGSGGLKPASNGAIQKKGSQSIKPQELDVKAGDFLQLAVMPKTNHGCDLTQVEWTIEEVEGKRRWKLVDDVIGGFLKSNPLPDRFGNPSVWFFYQVDTDRGEPFVPASPAELAKTNPADLERILAQTERRLAELRGQRDAMKSSGPKEFVYAAIDKDAPKNAQIRIRGERRKLGEEVPRKNLDILGNDPLPANTGSGRLQLADWLTREGNPLLARVMVNRIWQHHFGRGLVATGNDFGTRGARPTHPQLLDWLASRFKENGYSMKAMHRLIMASVAYQRSSDFDAHAFEIDPDARLLWRFNKRRLSAEEIRDAMLMVSGDLDPTMGGAHPFPPVAKWGFTQHAPYYGVYPTKRRSVYLMQQRLKRHPFLALFDGADTNVSTARRVLTTVPTQALYLMNNAFVHQRATGLARRVLAGANDEPSRIQLTWQLALGRAATTDELSDVSTFIKQYAEAVSEKDKKSVELKVWSAFARTILTRNEFLYVD
jgi:hypothetical protein